jgi:arginine deiminase
MATHFKIADLLKGDENEVRELKYWLSNTSPTNKFEDAPFLSNILRQVRDIMAENDNLSKKVRYSITERGQKEKDRLTKLLEYRGPDEQTINVLDQHKEEWMKDPSHFWILPLPQNLYSLNPRAQIVGCFLEAKDGDV